MCPERAKIILGDFWYHIEYVIFRLTIISSFQKCNCFFRIFNSLYGMIVQSQTISLQLQYIWLRHQI